MRVLSLPSLKKSDSLSSDIGLNKLSVFAIDVAPSKHRQCRLVMKVESKVLSKQTDHSDLCHIGSVSGLPVMRASSAMPMLFNGLRKRT